MNISLVYFVSAILGSDFYWNELTKSELTKLNLQNWNLKLNLRNRDLQN